MSQTYSVRINRKDLYKESYSEKKYKDKDKGKTDVINKSLVYVFIKMITEDT